MIRPSFQTSEHKADTRKLHLQAVGRVDTDGSRWLLGDHLGNLSLLVLNHDGPRVLSLALEPLGTVSAAVTLTYLDSGVIYVGSCSGVPRVCTSDS